MKINDFFKNIFYINLDHRTDRKQEFENEMKKTNITNYIRTSGVLPINKEGLTIGRTRQIACGKAHINLIKYAKENDLDNILIFEDDVVFIEDKLSIIEKALNDLSQIDDWDIFYFSGIVFDDSIKYITDSLVSANIVLANHAYAVNKRAYDRALTFDPDLDCIIDGWYGQQTDDNEVLGSRFKKYLIYPLTCYQRISISDIDVSNDGIASNGHGMEPYLKTYNKPIIK